MVRPIVNSVKHYVQHSISTVTASTITSVELIHTQKVEDVALVNDVREGAIVKAVFIEFWVRAGDTAAGSGIITVEKIPIDGANASTAEMAALGDYNNKKNVFYVTQGLYNDQDADAVPVLRQWIKIPKSKQRFGLGDRLFINFFAQGAIDMHICGFSTYKEYY